MNPDRGHMGSSMVAHMMSRFTCTCRLSSDCAARIVSLTGFPFLHHCGEYSTVMPQPFLPWVYHVKAVTLCGLKPATVCYGLAHGAVFT